MSSSVQGIQNYSKMNDKDKSYLVKLIGTMIMAVVASIITAIVYQKGQPVGISTGWLGLIIWFVSVLVLSYFIKIKFNLSEMTNMQIIRHGIFVGFLTYLYIWIVLFDYLAKNKLGI